MPLASRLSLLALMLLLGAAPLRAQLRPEVGLGVVVPTGDLGTYRRPGPVAAAGVVLGGSARRTRLRIGLEGAAMSGQAADRASTTDRADLRIITGAAELLLGPRGIGFRPYAVAGVAIHWMTAKGVANPYGSVRGLQAGLGVRLVVPTGLEVRAEMTPHLILSDFATGHDFSPGSYVPLTLRVAF